MNFRNLAYGVSAAAIMMSASTAVFAQETTGAVRGQIVDSSGVPLPGATVVVTHVPTGTSSTTLTDASGNYAARNLRVGGPYTVTISGAGVQEQSTVLSQVSIGAPVTLDILVGSDASADAAAVDDVVVTGSRSGGLRTGPRTTINAGQIETLPSISRDIKDFVRTSPFATVDPTNNDALILGGQNSRTNAFLVDGVRQSDDFGLNGNGYPTVNSPISISVLQSVSVDVAPFDVQYGSFQGGVVNSVTKSGSNQFHGELFFEKTDQDLQGDTFAFDDLASGLQRNFLLTGEFEEKTYGATLSGPIIKDRLFFLLNYEKFEKTEPVLSGPTGSAAPNQVPGITQADSDAVRNIVKNVYGYDPLDWSASELPTEDEKFFGRIDWNITDRHRAVLSYQQTDSSFISLNGTSTSATAPSLGLLSQGYAQQQNLVVYKAQLLSDWSDNFSTELSFSRKEQETISAPLGGQFAAMRVFLDPVGTAVRRSIILGTERSRHANELTNDIDQFRFVAKYQAGDHRLTAGYERETLDIFNVFVQAANGEYEFASLADLQNRQASFINYQNAGTNVKADGGATFSYTTNSLFAQDEYQVNSVLTLRAGLRLDWYEADDKPKENPAFAARYGFANNETLDGIALLQPRFGFNWKATNSLNVYGGIGLFQGGSPNVWISNNFSNTGNLIGRFTCRAAGFLGGTNGATAGTAVCADPTVLASVSGTTPPTGAQTGVTNSAALGTGDINVIDPTFKTPSIWKTSLGFTQAFDLTRFNIGDDWNVRGEYVHSEVEDAIGWKDLNQNLRQTATAPDGRPRYVPAVAGQPAATQVVLMLTNFKGGESDQATIGVNKFWNDGLLNGFGMDLSYTYTEATEVHPGTSSVAASNFGQVAVFDANNPEVATSNYEIRNSTKLNLSYSHAFFGDYRTRINLFGQRRSGLPFSYTFTEAGNGTVGETAYQSRNRQLLYVPAADSSGNVTLTSDPIIRYAAGFDIAGFNDYLKRTGLIGQAGQITKRNAYRSPDVTTFDLHLSQELPAFFPGGAKLEAYMDLENLGNLLNDEWGVIQQVGFPYFSRGVTARNCQIAGATGSTSCAAGIGNYYQIDSFRDFTANTFNNQSVWQIKLGVRYKF